MTDLREQIEQAAHKAKRSDADQQLEILIERRHELYGDDDELDPSWQRSVERFHRTAEAQRLQQWRVYHNDMARLHEGLAAEHRVKTEMLASRQAAKGREEEGA